jgi:hypothetical protein
LPLPSMGAVDPEMLARLHGWYQAGYLRIDR